MWPSCNMGITFSIPPGKSPPSLTHSGDYLITFVTDPSESQALPSLKVVVLFYISTSNEWEFWSHIHYRLSQHLTISKLHPWNSSNCGPKRRLRFQLEVNPRSHPLNDLLQNMLAISKAGLLSNLDWKFHIYFPFSVREPVVLTLVNGIEI